MINISGALNSFYNNSKINFKELDIIMINDIIKRSKKINKLFLNKEFKNSKSERYIKIMELINSNYREQNRVNNEFASSCSSEKFLLFMFSIDPKFEAAIIYGSENNIAEIKKQIVKKFGIFDLNLIKLEKYVINNLLRKEKRDKINEEINKRAFK